MRPWLIFLIFLAEAWAIAAILGSRKPARSRLAWTLGVILLPVVGVLAWIGRGHR